MIKFLSDNLGTILVGLAVVALVFGAVLKIARDKRKGKCIGCDGNCGGCHKKP